MVNPKEILSPSDYTNYRNVRAVSRLFVFLGSMLLLSGIFCTFIPATDGDEPIHPAFAIGMAFVGLTGLVGGLATLRGNRRWASAIKVMAVIYFFVFPVGTILSYVFLARLNHYLDNMERLQRENSLEPT
jgi:hypothetical protein